MIGGGSHWSASDPQPAIRWTPSGPPPFHNRCSAAALPGATLRARRSAAPQQDELNELANSEHDNAPEPTHPARARTLRTARPLYAAHSLSLHGNLKGTACRSALAARCLRQP